MHPQLHLYWTLGLVAVLAATVATVRNRAIRRRLGFSLLVFVAAIALHIAILELPEMATLREDGWRIEALLVAFAIINAGVTLVFNPWFREADLEGTPAIVQDTVTAALLVLSAMFVFQNSSFLVGLTGSAIVLGFALQETLGNAFSGLAIQLERPFRVGHWIAVAGFEGRVVEVTWRATKIRTKAGNLVSLPNSVVGKEPINNYSEPAAPTQLMVDVGASYLTPPNQVRAAIFTAIRQAPHVIGIPAPEVLLFDFADSAITYRARFWIDQFDKDEIAKDEVRRGIYYEFARRNIEIPWPIQIQYERQEMVEAEPGRTERRARIIAGVSVLAPLFAEGHRALAAGAREDLFGDGEVIVRQGEAGASLFVVCQGEVAITIDEGREVARTRAGGYFGEMSLLTGEPRTATVSARGDCTVLEIPGDVFREYVSTHPEVIDQLAAAAADRRRELDKTRAASAVSSAEARVSLADRMRRFFGLS